MLLLVALIGTGLLGSSRRVGLRAEVGGTWLQWPNSVLLLVHCCTGSVGTILWVFLFFSFLLSPGQECRIDCR